MSVGKVVKPLSIETFETIQKHDTRMSDNHLMKCLIDPLEDSAPRSIKDVVVPFTILVHFILPARMISINLGLLLDSLEKFLEIVAPLKQE